MDGKEVLLRLLETVLGSEPNIQDTRLEIDPGFIVIKLNNKNYIIKVEED